MSEYKHPPLDLSSSGLRQNRARGPPSLLLELAERTVSDHGANDVPTSSSPRQSDLAQGAAAVHPNCARTPVLRLVDEIIEESGWIKIIPNSKKGGLTMLLRLYKSSCRNMPAFKVVSKTTVGLQKKIRKKMSNLHFTHSTE